MVVVTQMSSDVSASYQVAGLLCALHSRLWSFMSQGVTFSIPQSQRKRVSKKRALEETGSGLESARPRASAGAGRSNAAAGAGDDSDCGY